MKHRHVIPTRRSRRARLADSALRAWAAVPAYVIGLALAAATAAVVYVGGWQ